ncbi:MAG TPA: HAD family hydrolase, partial [Parafilimonas sp.]
MRYHVLATDYDGTLAKDGKVNDLTFEALKLVKESGRKIILVTGREMKDLEIVFPEYNIFDLIVAENGALILNPENHHEILLGERPPENFIKELKQKKVARLSVGKVIVATWEPYQNIVLQAIKNAGIEHQIIFNKGAVMVLPPGVNKAKGLKEALKHLNISMHNVVAIGDAENDNAMLQIAECPAAVANALEMVKEQSAFVTNADHGEGVTELIKHLIDNDLAAADGKLQKKYLSIGKTGDETEYAISPYKDGVLLAGSSG